MLQRAGKHNRSSRSSYSSGSDDRQDYYDGGQSYGGRSDKSLPKMLVTGIVGYCVVCGIAIWCGNNGSYSCKKLSEFLCCCYFAPKAIYDDCCKAKKSQPDDNDTNETDLPVVNNQPFVIVVGGVMI